MNIPALSMAMKQVHVNQQVDISLMKKVMNTAEQNSDQLNKMLDESQVLQHAAQPHLGGSIDIKL